MCGDSKTVVILGDNIFTDDLSPYCQAFHEQKKGAKVLLKEVTDPQRFGVADVSNGKILGIEEKPKKPKSNLAVTGIYFYDPDVFKVIRTLSPSHRNELEITDVNNAYVGKGEMTFDVLKGTWTDAGTFESLWYANSVMFGEKSDGV